LPPPPKYRAEINSAPTKVKAKNTREIFGKDKIKKERG